MDVLRVEIAPHGEHDGLLQPRGESPQGSHELLAIVARQLGLDPPAELSEPQRRHVRACGPVMGQI